MSRMNPVFTGPDPEGPSSCVLAVSTACLRRVDGFPVRRLLTQAPSPLSAIASRLGHPEGSVQGVPRFRWISLSCCRARLYPVGTRAGGLRSGVRRLMRGCPLIPDLHSRKAGRLSLSLSAALPTSALARVLTLTRLQASVRIAARGRIASRASRRSEVTPSPTLIGSADVWCFEGTRFTSPICLSPRAAAREACGLAPHRKTISLQ